MINSPIFNIFLMLGSMVSITVGASLAKEIFPVLGPAGITFLRLGVAAIILILARRPWKNSLHSQQWRWVVIYGVILGVMNLQFYFAIERLPIGLAIAIEFIGPLAVALFMSRHWLDLVWALLAFLGVLLTLPQLDPSATVDLVGVLFALGAAAAWAGYILVGRKVGNFVPAANATSYGMLVGCLLVAPFGAIPSVQLAQHTEIIPSALGVGLLSSAIPYSLEMMALRHLSSKTFGIILSLEAAIGALSAFFILHETIRPVQLLAILCVLAASIGSTLSSGRSKKAELENEIAV